MLSWINPRVVVVIISVLGTLEVTQAKTFEEVSRRAVLICGSMIVLYVLAFLIPLRGVVKVGRLLGLLILLTAAWASTAVALIADAMPIPPEELLKHPWNWPRTAFVIAAGLAFYLFFDHAVKGFAVLRQLRAAGQGRWKAAERKGDDEATPASVIEDKEIAAKV